MGLVETAVLEIELEDNGLAGGEAVLLLHGWPDAPRGWLVVAARLHERGWRTIVPTLRGCGATRSRSTESRLWGRPGRACGVHTRAVAPGRVSAIVALALPYQQPEPDVALDE